MEGAEKILRPVRGRGYPQRDFFIPQPDFIGLQPDFFADFAFLAFFFAAMGSPPRGGARRIASRPRVLPRASRA